MLVHICCSVDSHYFLTSLRAEYPDEELIGYFYDPNIHPMEEYELRFLDVAYSCEMLNIKLIKGTYDVSSWLLKVKGFEHEPERGKRCNICFEDRLEKSIIKAKELKQNSFTTTLLISPQKSQNKLKELGEILAEKNNISFIFKDYRSGEGLFYQAKAVKQNSLYRQNYCGCLYALLPQRQTQQKLAIELFSPLSKQTLPNCAKARIKTFEKRNTFTRQKKDFILVKEKFLAYNLLNAKITLKNEVLVTYPLLYSMIGRKKTKAKIEFSKNNIFYLNKEAIKFISLKTFNDLGSFSYKSVKELMFLAPSFEQELALRHKISGAYDLSAIFVLEEKDIKKQEQNFEFTFEAKIYEDIKEVLI